MKEHLHPLVSIMGHTIVFKDYANESSTVEAKSSFLCVVALVRLYEYRKYYRSVWAHRCTSAWKLVTPRR
jgi:hypothetical protein